MRPVSIARTTALWLLAALAATPVRSQVMLGLSENSTRLPAFVFAATHDFMRNRIVALGQLSPNSPFANTYEFDGSVWIQRTDVPSTPLPSTWVVTACYSPLHGMVFVSGNGLGMTWTYDGIRWQAIASTLGVLVFDWGRLAVVSIEDRSTSLVAHQWTGSAWQQIGTTNVSPAYSIRAAFDWRRHVTVVVREAVTGRQAFEWDGTAWTTALAPPVFPIQTFHYVDALQACALIGNGVASAWDGTQWNPVPIAWSRDVSGRPAIAVAPLPMDHITILSTDRSLMPQTSLFSCDTAPAPQPFGVGCRLPAGAPVSLQAATMPVRGGSLTLLINAMPPGGDKLIVGASGLSRSTWRGVALPASLSPAFAGCNLWIAPDALAVIPASPSPAAYWRTILPASANLAGLTFFQQAACFVPSTNETGLSNGITLTIP